MSAGATRGRALLLVSTAGLAWLAMQVVHEVGHVLAAWASGGAVARVELPLLGFSRTILAANPHPRLVAWGGPAGGVVLPLVAWLVLRRARPTAAPVARFFAGFCLVANGLYLGAGSFALAGDCADLVIAGAPRAALVAFGLVATPFGLALWSGLGPHFGFGKDAPPVGLARAFAWAAAFAALAGGLALRA